MSRLVDALAIVGAASVVVSVVLIVWLWVRDAIATRRRRRRRTNGETIDLSGRRPPGRW